MQTNIEILLRKIRKNLGITQQQLADMTNIGRTTISNIENSVYIPGVDIALQIASALNLTVEDIFKLKGDNDK